MTVVREEVQVADDKDDHEDQDGGQQERIYKRHYSNFLCDGSGIIYPNRTSHRINLRALLPSRLDLTVSVTLE